MGHLDLPFQAVELSLCRTTSAVVLGGLTLILMAVWALSPRHDVAEPPILKPRIPFVGHIISLVRDKSQFHSNIQRAHPRASAGTLPMLNGKMYVIFDLELLHSTMRSRSASIDPFAIEFSKKTFGLSKKTYSKILARPGVLGAMTEAVHKSFEPKSLQLMNLEFLGEICSRMEDVGGPASRIDPFNSGKESLLADGSGIEVKNLYLWTRNIMTAATCKALYGKSSPFDKDPGLLDLIWTFEESIHLYLLTVFPSVTAPAAYKARQKLQTALKEYYKSQVPKNDPTVSSLVRNRAAVLSEYGFDDDELGTLELIPPQVAITNAAPTFYWMLVFVLSRPDLVKKLRAELESVMVDTTTDQDFGGEKVGTEHAEDSNKTRLLSLDITRFDKQLPLMVSCYRETIRLANSTVSLRRIIQDVTLKDSRGQTFLMKEGTDVHMPAAVTQRSTDIWGADAAEFKAERFLKQRQVDRDDKATEEAANHNSSSSSSSSSNNSNNSNSNKVGQDAAATERAKRLGYFPFGGGKHLCPGRNLAFCEVLGFMAVVLLLFDVEPVGMGFADIKMDLATMVTVTSKPVDAGKGLGARFRLREGWENVRLRFKC